MTALIAYFILQSTFLTTSPTPKATATKTTTSTSTQTCAIGWDDND
ncbi:hypothetical protein [Rhodocytophaga aerolata]